MMQTFVFSVDTYTVASFGTLAVSSTDTDATRAGLLVSTRLPKSALSPAPTGAAAGGRRKRRSADPQSLGGQMPEGCSYGTHTVERCMHD